MFNTEVDLDQIPELARTAFYDAVKRWDEVIVGDLPDVDTSLEIQNNTVCGDRVPDVIDDLFVCPRIEKMDGPGGLIGIVDVEWRRADSGLPVVGRMDFDLEDVPNLIFAGKFADVVVSVEYLSLNNFFCIVPLVLLIVVSVL